MSFSDFVALEYKYDRPLPDFQDKDDIRFPPSLARYLLERFTKSGDNVLDPFTGLGTTFLVCEEMGRVPYGIEADAQRYEWVHNMVQSKENLHHADSGDITNLTDSFPVIDFSLTSPPYMPQNHAWNPLYDGDPEHDGYDRYLSRLADIYRGIGALCRPGAHLVVQADNLTHEGFSPLVWDIGKTLSSVMTLKGEILVHWAENCENDTKFTQCLVFENSPDV